ncbi:hypothetical protein HF086_006940 [Spodoptera exigua]|uniref:Uncharacterized protein n=1 Tax=Spodoptera exigua TaxID=7107 RepID=A0A922MIW5_SPOEX|nr:hypothetical protein HF086_006940 [Spodoptera exigua]
MRPTATRFSRRLPLERPVCVVLFLMCMVTESWQGMMPWDKWTWSMPQEPIQYFFRKHDNLPVKLPNFGCECPPNNECVLDFKLNKDMVDFLNMRGVIKKEDVKSFQEDLKRLEQSQKDDKQIGSKRTDRNRRSNAEDSGDNCCCPPKNVYMPTFITDNKFDDVVNKFKTRVQKVT